MTDDEFEQFIVEETGLSLARFVRIADALKRIPSTSLAAELTRQINQDARAANVDPEISLDAFLNILRLEREGLPQVEQWPDLSPEALNQNTIAKVLVDHYREVANETNEAITAVIAVHRLRTWAEEQQRGLEP